METLLTKPLNQISIQRFIEYRDTLNRMGLEAELEDAINFAFKSDAVSSVMYGQETADVIAQRLIGKNWPAPWNPTKTAKSTRDAFAAVAREAGFARNDSINFGSDFFRVRFFSIFGTRRKNQPNS